MDWMPIKKWSELRNNGLYQLWRLPEWMQVWPTHQVHQGRCLGQWSAEKEGQEVEDKAWRQNGIQGSTLLHPLSCSFLFSLSNPRRSSISWGWPCGKEGWHTACLGMTSVAIFNLSHLMAHWRAKNVRAHHLFFDNRQVILCCWGGGGLTSPQWPWLTFRLLWHPCRPFMAHQWYTAALVQLGQKYSAPGTTPESVSSLEAPKGTSLSETSKRPSKVWRGLKNAPRVPHDLAMPVPGPTGQ